MPYFHRFDICEAYHLFACGYHVGGDTTDNIFGRLYRMHFRPSPFLGSSDDPRMHLTENGAEIYNQLIESHPDAAGVTPEYLPTYETED